MPRAGARRTSRHTGAIHPGPLPYETALLRLFQSRDSAARQMYLERQQRLHYLPQSIRAFPQGEIMQGVIRKAGFSEVRFRRLTFGICTLYIAKK